MHEERILAGRAAGLRESGTVALAGWRKTRVRIYVAISLHALGQSSLISYRSEPARLSPLPAIAADLPHGSERPFFVSLQRAKNSALRTNPGSIR